FAKLRHVREQWRFHFASEGFEFLAALQSFRKNPVCACFDIAPRALYCPSEILNSTRVCARDDKKILVAARPYRRFDFCNHLLRIDERFTRKMSAALGKFLILNVTTSQV